MHNAMSASNESDLKVYQQLHQQLLCKATGRQREPQVMDHSAENTTSTRKRQE
jgi:hypothetical protein